MRKVLVAILWVLLVPPPMDGKSTSSCFVSSPGRTVASSKSKRTFHGLATPPPPTTSCFHRVPSLDTHHDDKSKRARQSPLWRRQQGSTSDNHPQRKGSWKQGWYHKLLSLALAVFLALSPYCMTVPAAHAAAGRPLAPEQVVLVPSVHHNLNQASSESLLQRHFLNDDPATTTTAAPLAKPQPNPQQEQQQQQKSISPTRNSPALIRVRKQNQLQGMLFLVAAALATRMAALQGAEGPTKTLKDKDDNNDTETEPSYMLTRKDTFLVIGLDTTTSSSAAVMIDDDTVPPTGKLPPFLKGNPSVTVETYRQRPTSREDEDARNQALPTMKRTNRGNHKDGTDSPPVTSDQTPQRSPFLPPIRKRQPTKVDKDTVEIHSTSNASAASNTSLSAFGSSSSIINPTTNTSEPGVSLLLVTGLDDTPPDPNKIARQQQPPSASTTTTTTTTTTTIATATTTKMSLSRFKGKAVAAPPPPSSSLEELYEGTMGPLVEPVAERPRQAKKIRVASPTVVKDLVSPARKDLDHKDQNHVNKDSPRNQAVQLEPYYDEWNNDMVSNDATNLAALDLETQAVSSEQEVPGSPTGVSNNSTTMSSSSRQVMREEEARRQMMKLRLELAGAGRSHAPVEPTAVTEHNDLATLEEEVVESTAVNENSDLTMAMASRQVMRDEEARRQMMKLRLELTHAGRSPTRVEPTAVNENDVMTTLEEELVGPTAVNENIDLFTLEEEEVEPEPMAHSLGYDRRKFEGNDKTGATNDPELVARKLLETRLSLEAKDRLKRMGEGAAVELGRGQVDRSMLDARRAMDAAQEESESGLAGDLEAAASGALSAIGGGDLVSDEDVSMAEQIVMEATKDMAKAGISTHPSLQTVQKEEKDPSLSKIDDLERDMHVVTAEIMREDPAELYFADDAEAKPSAPRIFFFAAVRKDNDMSTPLEAKDIALFAGVLPDSLPKAAAGPSRWMPNYLPKAPMTIPPIWTPPPRIQVPFRAKRTPQPYVKLIPVNEAAVQLTSGILGAAVGFSIGGPALGLLSASAAHWASRDYERGGDFFDITQLVSEGTIGSINLAGAVLHTFEVDDMLMVSYNATTQKIPLLKGTGTAAKVAGDVLSIIGELNFMFFRSAVELSKSIHLPDVDRTSTMVNDWLQKVYHSTTPLRQPRQHVVNRPPSKPASSAYFIDMEAVRQSPEKQNVSSSSLT